MPNQALRRSKAATRRSQWQVAAEIRPAQRHSSASTSAIGAVSGSITSSASRGSNGRGLSARLGLADGTAM
ncbi:hypothetical protein [Frankia canadensis]|uniref:hypothetical protein n=1 Tax=Frankia canadensis TaxID=1836972 RepID=UPI001FB0079C|nr:hypothetical protein [Frankia canadensis]